MSPRLHEAPTPDSSDLRDEQHRGSLAGSIAATAILAFLGLFLETVVSVLFLALMRDFSVSTSSVQWLTSGYLLVVAVTMSISGYLQRRWTTRSLFLVAVASIAIGALIAMSAPNFALLLGGRILQGLGTGIITPLMFTIILTQAPPERLGALMGVGALTMGVAPALGPVVGGLIGQTTTWRAAFAIALPMVALSLLIGLPSIRQSLPTSQIPLRWGHVGLLALAFAGLVIGMERGGAALAEGAGLPGIALALVLLLLGIAAAAVFVLRSRSVADPILDLSVLANPVYRRGLIAFCLLQFAALGLGYLLPNLAQLALERSSMAAGLVVLPGAVMGALGAPLGGALLDRRGPRLPILLGLAVAVVATLGLALLGRDFTLVPMGLLYFLFMVGFGLSYANTQTIAMSGIRRSSVSDATALMNTLQQFSGAVAMTVLSTVLALAQAGLSTEDPGFAALSAKGGFIGFIVVALVVILGFISGRGMILARRTGASPVEAILAEDEARLAGAPGKEQGPGTRDEDAFAKA